MINSKKLIDVIDYGGGNTGSLLRALHRLNVPFQLKSGVGFEGATGLPTGEHPVLLPGVGAFDAGMANLEKSGLIPILNQKAVVEKVPVLGICLGMQLLSKKSEEGIKPGLAWIDAETVKFNLDPALKLKVSKNKSAIK